MRLTTIFLTAVLLSAYTPGASQQITYSGKQVKLVTVFKEVKKQTGYFIAYDLLLIEKAAPVTIRAINQPLNSFMKELLKGQPLSFRIEANTIVITPAPLKPPVIALPELEVLSPQSISGKVVDSLGKPIQGASVKIAGTSTGTITKSDGSFRINNVEQGRYTLEISSVGYETMIKMVSVSHQDVEIGTLTLQQSSQQMEDVVVVNTGYQKLKPNEMVGAVEVITSEQLNINTGTTILDRLKNLSTALSFDRISNGRVGSGNKLGITIRGLSTLNGPADPLIVLDNFIYDGDIENIDPNTIESVTILKDAVATSIWGPRAGNGVIVLTSKRAKRSSKPMISVRTATVIMPPPNLKKYPSADTRSFIDLELQHGITPNLTRYYDGYDPLKKIIIDRSKNLISAEDSARLVDELAQVDFRDEYQRAFYQTGIQQTYNISVSHGTEFVSTGFSAGFAKNETNLKAVDKRLNLGFNNAITLTKKLKLYQSLSYNNSQGRTGAPGFRSVNTFYNPSRSLPYIRFFEPDGSPSGYGYQFNTNFLDTFGRGMLLDWKFYPAEDYKHNYATSNVNALNLTTGLQYSLSKHFNLHIDYGLQSQNTLRRNVLDIQSYKARNMINSPAVINYTLGTVQFPIPVGDYFVNDRLQSVSHNGRASIHYTYRFNKHTINGMAGMEARSAQSSSTQDRVFGYNEDPLYAQPVYSLTTARHVVTGRSLDLTSYLDIAKPTARDERSVAAYFNINYTFDERMSLFLSYRQDGTNIFGMEKKEKWKPFWSVGTVIKLNDYLPHLSWLSQLQFNATLGISGNMDMSATTEAIAETVFAPYNNAVAAVITNVNNPYLSWERSKQLDLALHFGLFNNLLTGGINVYAKRGSDLYGPEPFDYTNYYISTILNNGSKMNGNGIDLSLNVNPRINELLMSFGFKMSRHIDKVTRYNGKGDRGLSGLINTMEGVSPNSLFVYQYKGLNQEGDAQFWYDGKAVTNPELILREFEEKGLNATSIKYLGSRVPTISTVINSRFQYRNFSLNFNLSYAGNFYTEFNNFFDYTDYTSAGILHKSYADRWQKPGDELHTNIPKLTVPRPLESYSYAISESDFAYRRGDNISLSAVNLAWNFRLRGLTSGTIGARLNDVGVIWSMEKDYKYRDWPNYTVMPISYAFDLTLNF